MLNIGVSSSRSALPLTGVELDHLSLCDASMTFRNNILKVWDPRLKVYFERLRMN
jgi:hypothetical protein